MSARKRKRLENQDHEGGESTEDFVPISYDTSAIVLGLDPDEGTGPSKLNKSSPFPKRKAHRYFDGPEKCRICDSIDHFAADCPDKFKNAECYNCGNMGHIAVDCPEPRKRKGKCLGCGVEGHFVRDCPNRGRGNNRSSGYKQKQKGKGERTHPQVSEPKSKSNPSKGEGKKKKKKAK